MDTSLPVPASQDRDLQNFAGHGLLTLSSNDVEGQASDPSAHGECTQKPTYLEARSWIAEFQKRLSSEMYSRFLDILSQCSSGTDMLETPRMEFSKLFTEAKELELWDEFLKSFFQPWKEMQEIEASESRIAEMMMESRDETEEVKKILEILEKDYMLEDPRPESVGLLGRDID
ncbi:MAG: hypothetical protein Q9216_003232 [Gyalolechia sp. 2 TL-2023]